MLQAKRLKLPKSFDILHIRAIASVYGEMVRPCFSVCHGAFVQGFEIIDLLKKTPASAAPVILQRLRQKDSEWRKAAAAAAAAAQ